MGARALGANTTTWNHYTHSFYNDADARHKAFTRIQPNAFTQAFGKSCTHDTRRFRTYEPNWDSHRGRAQRARKLGLTYRAMKRRRKAARWILGCRKVDTIGHTRLQHCVAVLLRKWIRRVRPTFLNRGSGDRAPLVSCVL